MTVTSLTSNAMSVLGGVILLQAIDVFSLHNANFFFALDYRVPIHKGDRSYPISLKARIKTETGDEKVIKADHSYILADLINAHDFEMNAQGMAQQLLKDLQTKFEAFPNATWLRIYGGNNVALPQFDKRLWLTATN